MKVVHPGALNNELKRIRICMTREYHDALPLNFVCLASSCFADVCSTIAFSEMERNGTAFRQ